MKLFKTEMRKIVHIIQSFVSKDPYEFTLRRDSMQATTRGPLWCFHKHLCNYFAT